MTLYRAAVPAWVLWVLLSTLLLAENAFKYSYVPKKVFQNQIFAVTVIDTRQTKSTPHFQFEAVGALKPISSAPLVIRNGNDNFYTFYFKASGEEITLPRLHIDADGERSLLPSYTIPVEKLNPPQHFCGVLAADMKIRNSQVSHYDEKNYLLTLSVEAYEADLEDMRLGTVEESGIEDIKRNGAKVEGEFYAVVPTAQKRLEFSYFNTIKQQFVTLGVPVELMESSVVTQTDLNPKEDSFEKLKKYTFMVLVGFFFLMFLLYRDFFYLVLGTVSLITLLTFYTPKEKVCVKQGASLYILPTETSSIGTKIDHKYTTPLLGERGVFNKIEYKHGIIGWVKDEDLCKN